MKHIVHFAASWLDQASDRFIRTLVIVSACLLGSWAAIGVWHQIEYMMGNWDRSPPIKVTPVGDPPVAKPGQVASVRVQITYDPARIGCSQTARRLVVDSKLVAYFLATDAVSGDARAELFDPAIFNSPQDIAFTVPVSVNAGPAYYENRLQFVCNKHQMKRPITYVWRAPFIVVNK